MLVEIAVVAADTGFRDNSREKAVMVSIGSNYETDEHLGQRPCRRF